MKQTSTQDLVLQLIEHSTYFDGEMVAKSLRNHADLWLAVIVIQSAAGPGITLREMVKDSIGLACDTLMIQTNKPDELLKVIKRWRADEVDVYDQRQSGSYLHSDGDGTRVIRVWFD